MQGSRQYRLAYRAVALLGINMYLVRGWLISYSIFLKILIVADQYYWNEF